MKDDEPMREMSAMADLRHDLPAWLEDAWMQRYLDRELSPAETDWFEAYCLDRDHLVARIEADLALRDALARERAQPAAEPMAARAPATRRPRALASAASLLAGLVLGGGIATWNAQRSDDMATSVDVTRLWFDTLRGGGDPARVDHASSGSPLVIVDLAVPADATDVVLHVSGQPDRALTPGSDGIVTALVPREVVRAATISISYRRGGERVQRALAPPAGWESQ